MKQKFGNLGAATWTIVVYDPVRLTYFMQWFARAPARPFYYQIRVRNCAGNYYFLSPICPINMHYKLFGCATGMPHIDSNMDSSPEA
jgi:hypothetical protein